MNAKADAEHTTPPRRRPARLCTRVSVRPGRTFERAEGDADKQATPGPELRRWPRRGVAIGAKLTAEVGPQAEAASEDEPGGRPGDVLRALPEVARAVADRCQSAITAARGQQHPDGRRHHESIQPMRAWADSLGLDLQFTKVVLPSPGVEEGGATSPSRSLHPAESESAARAQRAVAQVVMRAHEASAREQVASDTGRDRSRSRPTALPAFPAVGDPTIGVPPVTTRLPTKSHVIQSGNF